MEEGKKFVFNSNELSDDTDKAKGELSQDNKDNRNISSNRIATRIAKYEYHTHDKKKKDLEVHNFL